jgi:hypothetical protein
MRPLKQGTLPMQNKVTFIHKAPAANDNILQFPAPEKQKRFLRGLKKIGKAFLSGIGQLLRYVLFAVLLCMRKPVHLILGFFCSPWMLLGIVFVAFGMDKEIKLFALTLCIGAFLGSALMIWCYDQLILKLSPEPIILT